jgi:ribosome biogenesis GTPase / thiamine phosphate phosphatase
MMAGQPPSGWDLEALRDWGFDAFFHEQLAPEQATVEARGWCPARITEVQRRELRLTDGWTSHRAAIAGKWYRQPPLERPAVGDWTLFDPRTGRVLRRLERRSLLSRMAAGPKPEPQLLGANIDVLFIVSSCNEEFNLSRLERYLALASQAGITPVILLTKADLHDPAPYLQQVQTLGTVRVQALNAKEAAAGTQLQRWCERGRTLAFVGSSGVGKSTLVNTLLAQARQSTAAVGHADKGRHTTSYRSLHLMPQGGVLLDTPGIRELQLAGDDRDRVADVFADIEALAAQCRFNDCAHQQEPGCAVQAAIADGRLEARRLASYRKLKTS